MRHETIIKLVLALVVCLFFLREAWFYISLHRITELVKETALIGFLLWFMATLVRRGPDDDWAGQP